MHRRDFISAVAASAIARPSRAAAHGFHLIAHRGGVVDASKGENSAAAITAAIEHGYWMIEVDVRRSKDGEPVLYHDPTLERYYGTARQPEELTWKELKALRSNAGGTPPVHFVHACAMCGGKMRLMLDLKANAEWPREFYGRLLRAIEQARIPQPVYTLGGARVKPLFEGRVMVSTKQRDLAAAAERGEPVARDYFLFELGNELDAGAVSLCRKLKVVPVAAINTHRYTMAKRDETKGPAEDVAKLRRLGVTHYQIDSRYEPLFV